MAELAYGAASTDCSPWTFYIPSLPSIDAVIAITHAHASALFPGMLNTAHSRGVFGGPIATVFVACVTAPAIVYNHFVLDR